MSDFKYVPKERWKPVRDDLERIIHKVQDRVREQFTFSYRFVGSGSNGLITEDVRSNIGFDFDVDLCVNDDDENYSEEKLRHVLMNAFDLEVIPGGYKNCEDHTRVFKFKYVDPNYRKINHSCDFAIVRIYTDKYGNKRRQYIRFDKKNSSYYWADQSSGYMLEDKETVIRHTPGGWKDVKDTYLQKKNDDINKDKKSRALYAETINEVYERCERKEKMSKSGNGVSGNTHTQQQRNNYANQHNPNNNAYKADRANHSNQCNPNNAAYRQSREGSKK